MEKWQSKSYLAQFGSKGGQEKYMERKQIKRRRYIFMIHYENLQFLIHFEGVLNFMLLEGWEHIQIPWIDWIIKIKISSSELGSCDEYCCIRYKTNMHYFTLYNLNNFAHCTRVTLSKVYHYPKENLMHDVCIWSHSAVDHDLHFITLLMPGLLSSFAATAATRVHL